MPQGDFGGKRNSNGFDKNPENINKQGLNRKVYSSIIKNIKEKGYEVPKRDEVFEFVGLLMVMNEDDLLEFENNQDNPKWGRDLINDITDKKTRQKLMSEYRDWMFGKAEQGFKIENGSKLIIEIDDLRTP